MVEIQKNNNRFFLSCSLLMATAYFAGCKRFIQHFPGATQKDLLGIAGVATLASGVLRHENNRKSALLVTSISLVTAAILKTLNTSIKWESSTFLKVGAVQALIFGGCFTQKRSITKTASFFMKVNCKIRSLKAKGSPMTKTASYNIKVNGKTARLMAKGRPITKTAS